MIALTQPRPAPPASQPALRTVAVPGGDAHRPQYTANREPLAPHPLLKLPIGAITPKGWMRTQLRLMADGFVGHLPEISSFCRDDSGWLRPTAGAAWEEVPYWLRGFGDLAYLLKDKKLIAEAHRWTDALIASQDTDGYFGSRANKAGHDFWPNMLMLPALQSRHEATGDERIPGVMSKYFKYRAGLSDAELFPARWGDGPYNDKWWQHVRASDELESIYWLYNRTGDAALLKLAERIYSLAADWNDRVSSWHGVNICQGFRGPAVFYQQKKDRALLEGSRHTLQKVFDIYGQVPGGMFGADENCREGFTDPRQAAETCSMVELMYSFEYLLRMTGEIAFADRCENVAFNSLPASMTPNLKGLHYLTAPNMVQLDRHSKAPGLQNGGTMLAFSPHRYRCCQHNVAMGWPYFSEHLWMATRDGGLAAAFYAESEVTAKVADGVEVTISETTDYPFDHIVRLRLTAPRAVRFPLVLRVPGWCNNASVKINAKPQPVEAAPRSWVVIDRTWSPGDLIELTLPMELSVTRWPKSHNAASVSRGPLTYSLKIGERWEKYADPDCQPFCDADQWPAHEVFASTPWNYGLVLDGKSPESSFKVVRATGKLAEQPFAADHAPISLVAAGVPIEAWRTDHRGLCNALQDSPVRVDDAKPRQIELIPMGCARLRISAFPVIGDGPDARAWIPPRVTPHHASHCYENDDVAALSDDRTPKNSGDHDIPRFTWWPRRGTTEWVTYEFATPRSLRETHVYWFDDTGTGHCRLPKLCRLFCKRGDDWLEAPRAKYPAIERDKFNTIAFDAIATTALKLEVQLAPEMSAGILEWVVGPLGPS